MAMTAMQRSSVDKRNRISAFYPICQCYTGFIAAAGRVVAGRGAGKFLDGVSNFGLPARLLGRRPKITEGDAMNQQNYRRFAREMAIFSSVCRTAAGLLMPAACIGLMSRWDDCYAGCVVMFGKLGLSLVAAVWVSKFLAGLSLVLLAFFTVRGMLRFVFSPSTIDRDLTVQWFPCPARLQFLIYLMGTGLANGGKT
jgi:hypothetical protein